MMRLVINKLLFVLWFGFTMMFSTVSYGESMKSMTMEASGISRLCINFLWNFEEPVFHFFGGFFLLKVKIQIFVFFS